MKSSSKLFANSYLVYALAQGIQFSIEDDIRDSLKGKNISFPSFRLLWILTFSSHMTMSQLSCLSQTNISNVYRKLTNLKERGLVDIQSGKNARSKEITITKTGRELVHGFIDQQIQDPKLDITKVIDHIPKHELHMFLKVAKFLSDELIGKPFTEWISSSAKEIHTFD
ncbi:MarR family winged helix-turn-helix transcriptional regulator [Salinibacillus xinjiangensis]|uniref:HTH marR-type domain-containing protein n=1 Tax=Salinibacillus xinjiangensis TaxID=1229268 RepID=A0A6G1X9W5_9BACI|nr:hypothetical protein [Salinibacillus xinjiangensis]MRG87803.1 hypothetical protein [Salinibacillus xinjiangensis]